MRRTGRKLVGALKKVTGSGSSRSQGGSSSHRSSTPTQSYTREPEESHEEHVESPAPYEQAEEQQEEAPDDSHIELRGDREFQTYNILKDRVFGHTRVFDEDLLEKTGMDSEFASVWKAVGWSSFAEISEMGSRD